MPYKLRFTVKKVKTVYWSFLLQPLTLSTLCVEYNLTCNILTWNDSYFHSILSKGIFFILLTLSFKMFWDVNFKFVLLVSGVYYRDRSNWKLLTLMWWVNQTSLCKAFETLCGAMGISLSTVIRSKDLRVSHGIHSCKGDVTFFLLDVFTRTLHTE